MANLTRDEMKAVIDRGESVFFRGRDNGLRIATRHEHLPSDADLARQSADPDKVAAAKQLLEERKRAIDAELAALDQPLPPKADDPASPAVAPAPAAAIPAPAVAPAPAPKVEAKPEPKGK